MVTWFEQKLSELSEEERYRGLIGDDLASKKRNVTLPLNIEDHYMLERIADTLGMTKTAVCVNMLSDALATAYDTISVGENETPEEYWANVRKCYEKGGE